MEYQVHVIHSEDELSACPAFRVDHFQWTCKRRPETTGRMGYLPGKGFLLRMECVEADPKREYTQPMDPVCRDSAVEAFFTFAPECAAESGKPDNNCMYLNFEMNANGAMHAKYGKGRKGRQPLSPVEYKACGCRARVDAESWSVELLIPLPFLERVYGIREFRPGDRFFCNFYKISESPEIEHYASYSPIQSETPNFHLPEWFAGAVIV